MSLTALWAMLKQLVSLMLHRDNDALGELHHQLQMLGLTHDVRTLEKDWSRFVFFDAPANHNCLDSLTAGHIYSM